MNLKSGLSDSMVTLVIYALGTKDTKCKCSMSHFKAKYDEGDKRASCANREECSEIDESSESESEDEFERDNKFDSDYENYSTSANEEEDNLDASRGRKRMRLWTDSEDDSEGSNERKNIKIAIDGTVRKKIETSSSPFRPPLHPDSFGDYLHSDAKVSKDTF
ncbi:hypothetical protein AVEN_222392-1 [Araneus ventricosus]|uniref:Uncharacterized protein n=1 Tax=Araneus ventricosus TaxID=182803 RepID=A0A4Y2LWX7_ARAVE|nr:hypothetical protein AVEN_222392-1 [Araneus ventricosus]